MKKPLVSQGLGYSPPVTLITNGSVLPGSGMVNLSVFQKVVHNHLASLPLFQKVILPAVMTTLYAHLAILSVSGGP